MVSSPSPSPPFADVAYSKFRAASFSSLEFSSAKTGRPGHEEVQHNKFRAFCASYGGWALACAAAVVSICLVTVLFIKLRHGHSQREYSPVPASAPPPSIAPESGSPQAPSPPSAPVHALPLSSLCNTTDQVELCLTTLSTIPSTLSILSLQDLTAFVAKTALGRLNETYLLAVNISRIGAGGSSEKAVLQDCLDLLDQARDGLNDSINQLSTFDLHAESKVVQGQVMNLRVWMSSSYTDQDTCWDEFQDVDGAVKDQLLKSGQPIGPLISIALSFAQVLLKGDLSIMYEVHPVPP